MASPPPLPPGKSLRTANLLNLLLPGAGQIYLGQHRLGGLLLGLFLVCLLGLAGSFVMSSLAALNLTLEGNILEGDRLEQIGEAWHPRWLIGFAVGGGIVFLVSFFTLSTPPSLPPGVSANSDPAKRVGK